MSLQAGASFPRRGEIYDVDFNPARGNEQGGRRPALVVSNDVSNEHSGVVIVAAITSQAAKRQYPWDVPLPAGDPLPLEGRVMCNQLMTVAKVRLLNRRGELSADQLLALKPALQLSLSL